VLLWPQSGPSSGALAYLRRRPGSSWREHLQMCPLWLHAMYHMQHRIDWREKHCALEAEASFNTLAKSKHCPQCYFSWRRFSKWTESSWEPQNLADRVSGGCDQVHCRASSSYQTGRSAVLTHSQACTVARLFAMRASLNRLRSLVLETTCTAQAVGIAANRYSRAT